MMNNEHSFFIATLDKLIPPDDLDGRNGKNRDPIGHSLIDANNDLQAINLWLLSLESARVETFISYRNSVEKLINWSCFSRRKAVSSLNSDDIRAFITFMGDPQPSSVWIAPNHESRDSIYWKPFRGPLSKKSIGLVIAAISLLFDWMRKNSYANMPKISPSQSNFPIHEWNKSILEPGIRKIITQKSWTWITEYIFSVLDVKVRLLIELFYFGNLRSSDIQNLRISDCIAPSDECIAWRIKTRVINNSKHCLYALPPIGTSLSQWFHLNNIQPRTDFEYNDSRIYSPLFFANCMNHRQIVKKVLYGSSELAKAEQDFASENELRVASMICLRGALEMHAGSDGAFGLGLIAHSRECRIDAADYFREITLTNEMIKSGWKRLEDHWKPYNDRMKSYLQAGSLI